MAFMPGKISIPFQPLLSQIADCLQFPKPTYNFVDVAKNSACVCVKAVKGLTGFLFYGSEASTVEESCELAAQKVVRRLMQLYGAQVADFTADRMKMYRLCEKLFRLKRAELVSAEKGLATRNMEGSLSMKVPSEILQVSVDCVGFLDYVVRKTGACVTPIETVMVNSHGFMSWLSVTCAHNNNGMECIFSEPCSDVGAKQRVATKAICYLVYQYNLEIIDANYGSAAYIGVQCSLERETYIVLRERVISQKDKSSLMPFLVEQRCLAPQGEGSQIPKLTAPPLPPMKRKSRLSFGKSVSSCSGNSVPLVDVPPELETVFKRAKVV